MISILIGFVCCLLAGFLLTVPSRRRLPNRFLAVFLLLTALELTGWVWVDADNYNGLANGLRIALGNLQMPIFLGFYLSSCFSDFALKRHHYFHLVPLGLGLVLTLPGNQLPFDLGSATQTHVSAAESLAFQVGAHALYYGYMMPIIAVLLQFRKRFKAHHSGARSEMFTWLSQLAVASLIAHTLILLRDLVALAHAYKLVSQLQVAGAFIALGITTWIALKSLLQPHLFRNIDRQLLKLTTKGDYATNADCDRLLGYMEDVKPYLDPDLSLSALSDQLAMTPREVSEIMNQSLGMHFFDFVNSYRVKAAKQLLMEDTGRSVIDTLHAVGFNSKSSFNTAFKKHTGLTPSAFRRASTHT